MRIEITKEDVKKSQKCPPGMHLATLKDVEEEYMNDKGTNIQKANFETVAGYTVPCWFNDKMISTWIEFVEAADNIKFDKEMSDTNIELAEYVGKKVAISVSHVKDKNNKIQSQIDNFFSSEKVPF